MSEVHCVRYFCMFTHLILTNSVWHGFYCPHFAEASVEVYKSYVVLLIIKVPIFMWMFGFKAIWRGGGFPLSAEWRAPLGCFGITNLQVPSQDEWERLKHIRRMMSVVMCGMAKPQEGWGLRWCCHAKYERNLKGRGKEGWDRGD